MPATTPSAKEATLRVVENLDDEATFEDIMYELYVLQKIERGQRVLIVGGRLWAAESMILGQCAFTRLPT